MEISTSAPPTAALQVGELGQLAGRAVDGVLDGPRPALHLLDPAGRELQQLGQHELGLLARATRTARPDHAAWLPSARRSLANIDSCERRFSSVRRLVQPLEQLALLVAEAPGNDDVDDHAQIAAAAAAQRGHPLARAA